MKLMTYCIEVNKTKLILNHDRGVAIDISTLDSDEVEVVNNRLQEEHKDSGLFDREKIFSSRYFGNSLCIIPSNKCQLRCKYCYSSSGNSNSCQYVEFDLLKQCIDKLFCNATLFKKVSDFKLNFIFHGGGEPTENWPLFQKIVKYIQQKSIETGYGVYLKIVTNGIMNSEQARWISEVFDQVVVSVDGPNCINDEIRVFKNNAGSTDVAMASAEIFAKNTKLGIHSVVTTLSIGKEKEIIDFFKTKIPQVSFINFQRCRSTEHGRNEVLAPSFSDFLEFLQAALRYAPELVKTSIADITRKKAFCKGCSGNMLYCFPNGNITACNEHDDGIYKIGSYKEGNGLVIDAMSYQRYKESVAEKMQHLNCEECFAVAFCRGGCHSHYLQSAHFKEEWCEIFKEITASVLKNMMESSKILYGEVNGKVIRYFYY